MLALAFLFFLIKNLVKKNTAQNMTPLMTNKMPITINVTISIPSLVGWKG